MGLENIRDDRVCLPAMGRILGRGPNVGVELEKEDGGTSRRISLRQCPLSHLTEVTVRAGAQRSRWFPSKLET